MNNRLEMIQDTIKSVKVKKEIAGIIEKNFVDKKNRRRWEILLGMISYEDGQRVWIDQDILVKTATIQLYSRYKKDYGDNFLDRVDYTRVKYHPYI